MRVYIVKSYDSLTYHDQIHEVFAEEDKAEAYANGLRQYTNDDTIDFYVVMKEVK